MAIGGNANASKRKFAVAGVVLLVLAVLVALFAGGTFAKYVTEDDGSDTARVAKWGVEIEGGYDVFDASYAKDDPNVSLEKKNEDGSAISVDSYYSGSEQDNVLAPGTTKTYEGITVSGTPEVAVKVRTEATVSLNNWDVQDGDDKYFYCPLIFTIGGKVINGLDYSGVYSDSGSIANSNGGKNGLINKIKEAIEEQAAGSELQYQQKIDGKTYGVYDAGTDLGTCGISTGFTWTWPFESENLTMNGGMDQDDEFDTLLANVAADYDKNNDPAITIELTTTVEQVN